MVGVAWRRVRARKLIVVGFESFSKDAMLETHVNFGVMEELSLEG